ncbi:31056_t:CDS:2, partial [Gigaspora margarita]
FKWHHKNANCSHCVYCDLSLQMSSNGNKLVDNFVKKTFTLPGVSNRYKRLEFVPFERLINIEYLAEGGFSKLQFISQTINVFHQSSLEIVPEYKQEQNQDGNYDFYKNLNLVELCQEIVTKYEQKKETNYDINKNFVHILDSNDGVPKESLPSMIYDIDVPLSCDASGSTLILQLAFTANQLNGSPTTSTDAALSDSMFNSSYLEFEENQFAPIMRGQKTNSLCFIHVNPANRSVRKKSKTKTKKPPKPPMPSFFQDRKTTKN